MNKKTIFAIISILVLAGTTFLLYSNYFKTSSPKPPKAEHESGEQQEEKIIYTCPMHPSVVSDKPGACPICGMSLVPKTTQKESSGDEIASLQSVSLSANQRVMANISTTHVVRRAIENEINTTGVVDIAEPLQSTITARFRGRIEQLFVNYAGQHVKQGEKLFSLYSPDLVSAEQEYMLILNSQSDVADALYNSDSQQNLREAARERLRLRFGFTETQIADIDSTRKLLPTVTFYSPISGTILSKNIQEGEFVDEGTVLYKLANLSKVWVYIDVYEKDIRFLSVNQTIHITTESYPDEMFTGNIKFIDPVLNPETRTIRIRTEFANPQNKLKPQMWVKAHIVLPSKNTLVIPTTAILSTGKRTIVWVEIKENSFEPRDITTGVEANGYTEVLSNLNEDESVVVTGAYLLESESQLQAPTGVNPHAQHSKSDKDNSMKDMDMNNKDNK